MTELKEFTGFRKGVNFGGWLSQCDHTKERYDNFIKESDFANVKALGYDHIRLPIDYELIETEEGEFIEDGFKYIEYAIENCRKNGLNMVLDLHRTPGFSFDPGHNKTGFFESEELQKRFYDIWQEISVRFGKYSDSVCFELLNEVTDKSYCDTWNKIATNAIGVIRKNAKDVKIIVGGYHNNSAEAVKDIDVPVDDNIIFTFHFYEPLLFTHQGAPWIATMDVNFRCKFDMTYGEYDKESARLLCQAYTPFSKYDANKVIGEEYFENLILEAINAAKKKGVSLYCGEFGVIDRAAKPEAEKWFKMFYGVMEKYEIASSIWSYREMDFGIVE